MAKNVTIYTTNTCAYCYAVKDYFKSRNVQFDEINLDEYPEKRQELIQLSGQLAVPVTVVTKDDDTKDITVGFNLSKLASALGF